MSIKETLIRYISDNKKINYEELVSIFSKVQGYAAIKNMAIERFSLTEEEVLLIFSREFKVPFLDLKKYRLHPNNKDLLPESIAFKYKVVPICKIGEVLTLGTSNPLEVVAYDDIRLVTGVNSVDIVLCRSSDIEMALNNLYRQNIKDWVEDYTSDIDVESRYKEKELSLEQLIKESSRPLIVRVLDNIIFKALKKRASDIHIEPTESSVEVKYRIDGLLYKEISISKQNQHGLIARLKVISSLNITETRIPQDGRFKVKFENRQIDFRVSSLPTYFGEKFVLRILDKESIAVGLERLGFSPAPLQLFEEALKAPFGIILVTGPTGSGKSTTLYSIINRLNSPDRNIITIEDPVEYQVDGITQIQVKPEIGLTFAQGLRSILRQSPDIILVGEIRDFETADIAIKASLTGQLIFSTLHTNSSVGAITRLIDMGVEPFLLSSSLVASTAQRLVRKLCPHCKEKNVIHKEELKNLNIRMDVYDRDVWELYKSKGCNNCNHHGYKGRLALLEVLLVDDHIKEQIISGALEDEIIDYAYKNRGFRTLWDDGLYKCFQEGVTTIEEVLRVTID